MQLGNLTWDASGKHYYYTGIDAVALYVWDERTSWYGRPYPWNGVTALNESPSGAESNKLYADNIEYLNLLSKEEFGCTLECYQTPDEFAPCDGIRFGDSGKVMVRGQIRKSFGLVYRVKKGSDTIDAGGKIEGDSNGSGYVYHVVYGCKASPSSRDFATVNDSPEAQTFSYEIATIALTDTSKFPKDNGTPLYKEIAHIEIDGSKLTTAQEADLIAVLFSTSSSGSGETAISGVMPTPRRIATACGYESSDTPT